MRIHVDACGRVERTFVEVVRADGANVAVGVQAEAGSLVDVLADVAVAHDAAHGLRPHGHLAPLLGLGLEGAHVRAVVVLAEPGLGRRERWREQLARADLLAALLDDRGERVDDPRVEALVAGGVLALEPLAVRKQLCAARAAR